MQQVQDIKSIKMNITKIISDCQNYKFQLNSQLRSFRKNRFKTQPNQNQVTNKKLDYDTCLKNIHDKVRSLQSSFSSKAPTFRDSSPKLRISSFSLTQQQDSYQKSRKINQQTKQSSLPQLMKKYQSAHDPKNASSSQKYTFLDKDQKSSKKLSAYNQQQHLSYNQIKACRLHMQQMQQISMIGRLVKQNVARQNKQMIERKKKRKLQQLNLKEIFIRRPVLKTR